MLESMTGWFTPTSLFVLLNLVIGTIWLTSLFGTHNHHHLDDPSPYLARPRSFLDRVRSFNYNSHSVDDPIFTPPEPQPLLTRSPSLLDRVRSLSFKNLHFPTESGQHQDHSVKSTEAPNREPEQQVKRSRSDGEVPLRRGAEKMVRSASEKKAGSETSDAVERRRPATARVERTASIGADVEVDVRADDFINRFKQQLKLQRLDSLLRYQEMITRG